MKIGEDEQQLAVVLCNFVPKLYLVVMRKRGGSIYNQLCDLLKI